jgi:hypothetical protein
VLLRSYTTSKWYTRAIIRENETFLNARRPVPASLRFDAREVHHLTVGKLYKAAADAAPDVIDRASPWDETLNCAYETQLKYCGSNRLPSYS